MECEEPTTESEVLTIQSSPRPLRVPQEGPESLHVTGLVTELLQEPLKPHQLLETVSITRSNLDFM